jgi:predicted nuclease of predicted toxin-antitoxin system
LPSNEIKHTYRLTDLAIWKFAKANHYSILTFDEDFVELQNLFSYPPKIIWLRTGNVRTGEIASLLIKIKREIDEFLANDELGIYEIYL